MPRDKFVGTVFAATSPRFRGEEHRFTIGGHGIVSLWYPMGVVQLPAEDGTALADQRRVARAPADADQARHRIARARVLIERITADRGIKRPEKRRVVEREYRPARRIARGPQNTIGNGTIIGPRRVVRSQRRRPYRADVAHRA